MINNYEDLGYSLFNEPTIEHSLLDNALNRIPAIMRGESDTGLENWGIIDGSSSKLSRVAQPHMCSSAFRTLLVESNIGTKIASILECESVSVWGSQLYLKPPGSSPSFNVGLHRDSQHMPFFKSGIATLWIPLSDVSGKCGSIKYIQHSHNKRLFPCPKGGQELNINAESNRLKLSSNAPYLEQEITLPKGGFSLHHWDLIHGSGQNKTQEIRAALSIGIYTENIQVDLNQLDYGYKSILDNPIYCPNLFKK
ncbi:phytanoyl-CoA dioxygenase family protein [Pseudoalteromonas sp. MMG012]|uniref:phytanoyl-CoA dioxygenase family protein n=1 Tax=Pseudoalteromonas sp. MMG012 TaxID=2822686 RepID=UPI001B3A0635|nr:phytanoyl-CoA dioxygenase family protein [Pseudoalteromonas sp. MMG012]MBQ4850217.1 phytanoyl-CoA dioxygenase family protein [Pseudoalteromonas sp. MMG012]